MCNELGLNLTLELTSSISHKLTSLKRSINHCRVFLCMRQTIGVDRGMGTKTLYVSTCSISSTAMTQTTTKFKIVSYIIPVGLTVAAILISPIYVPAVVYNDAIVKPARIHLFTAISMQLLYVRPYPVL